MSASFEPFDVCDALPSAHTTTLLEASAGTGKTWTIGALVTRYIVEGHAAPEDLLVVTFGRAATRELRQRVREQLSMAYEALRDRSPAPRDQLLTLLLDADEAELAERERRARAALANYDSATIVTTHEFCSLVLRSLGVAGDFDAGARLVENLDDLVDEVVADVYLQRYGSMAKAPFTAAVASRVGAFAVENGLAVLSPDDGGTTIAGQRRDFAVAVRAEVDRRKRRRGLLSYDDLLSRLAHALRKENSPAALRMRERWSHVLVDEFQDTDEVQWEVLDRAFSGHATMVLIGDPKQAIYRFRGGDIPTYLRAASEAGEHRTLDTNWRSDGALVDALQVLLGGAALGNEHIRVHPVKAREREPQVVGLPESAPVRLRQVLAEPRTGDGAARLKAGQARELIADDLAADIAATLTSGARYQGDGEDRPLVAGDIAVLMFSLKQASQLTDALDERGITSVVANSGSVMTTQAATDWLALLDALNQPQRAGLLRSVALTPFIGLSPEALAGIDEDARDRATEDAADRVRGWLDLARRYGIAAVHESLLADGLAERVLKREDGERRFTDLHHVGQVLHEVAQSEGFGLAALAQWLRAERRLAKRSTERARRLDTDSDAVQILTIHGSKGLQFPIVYLPFAFNNWIPDDRELTIYHEGLERRADVGGAPSPTVVKASLAEDAAEELRLTYVALTRAQSQVVLWWAPTRDAANGGPSRLLFDRAPGDSQVADTVAVRSDAEAREVFQRWQEAGALHLEVAEPVVVEPLVKAAERPVFAARQFTRQYDQEWRRTSYSGLIRVDEVHATSEPEVEGTVDEALEVEEGLARHEAVAEPGSSIISPMAELPAGAAFGSLVHAVLETADPLAPDLAAELVAHTEEHMGWWSVEVEPSEMASALLAVHQSSLGPLANNLTLADFGWPERLRELDFEIPLAGGDHADPLHDVLLRDMAGLLRRYLPTDDPMLPYADRLEAPELGAQVLRGYLTGSIDLVLRVPAEAGTRYVVADYKTNLLPTAGEQATAWDYRPEALAEAMLHSHYPLQAMLYSVVLHRYLRWRLPDYQPERDLGGVMYLYLRGMCGPETPTYDGNPAGVFSWEPPAEMIVALSELLAGRAS